MLIKLSEEQTGSSEKDEKLNSTWQNVYEMMKCASAYTPDTGARPNLQTA